MSKLYVKTSSERTTEKHTLCGNEFLNIEVMVGCRSHPIKLAEITIDYEKKKKSTIYRLWSYGNVVDIAELDNASGDEMIPSSEAVFQKNKSGQWQKVLAGDR